MRSPNHRRLTARLVEHSSKLDNLTLELRRLGSQLLTPELLDELAVTVDELLLTLDEHRHACGSDDLVNSVISEARALTRGVRAPSLDRERVAESASGVAWGLARDIRQDKLAA
jgi:hypothetical protein